ncbi:MAG TPA: hypothetical protein VK785_09150, partial [Opitutaceae bacterium]|nr:hypothetical protein [Opitutaceae bacterium]
AFFFSSLTRHVGKDATTDLAAFDLFDKLPKNILKIAESGITSQNVGGVLKKYPFNAALIGTSLLQGDTKKELDYLDTAITAALLASESIGETRRTERAFAHA